MAADGLPVAVLFAEFDNRLGRTLSLQEPAGYLSPEAFDDISEYLIPKPQLCGRLIVMRGAARNVLCWPVCLEDTVYERNALFFTLALVLEPAPPAAAAARSARPNGAAVWCADCSASEFGEVLRRACGYLVALERKSRLVSGPGSRDELRHLLPALLHGLQTEGGLTLALDAAHSSRIDLPRPPPPRAPAVEAHLVPVLIAQPDPTATRKWDLTVLKLLPAIDGVRTVARLAANCRVDLALTKLALQSLLAARWIQLLDPFAFSNAYAATRRLQLLIGHPPTPAALQACAAASLGGAAPAPALGSVLRLLGAFRPTDTAGGAAEPAELGRADPGRPDILRRGELPLSSCGWRSVLDVCLLFPTDAAAVDLRALIAFATANRMLRRVHVMPVAPLTPRSPGASAEAIPEGGGGGAEAAGGVATAESGDGRRGMGSGTDRGDTVGGQPLPGTCGAGRQADSPPSRRLPLSSLHEDGAETLSRRSTSESSLLDALGCAAGASGAAVAAAAAAEWRKLCDGHRTMDQICCELGMPLEAAEELVADACLGVVWLRK